MAYPEAALNTLETLLRNYKSFAEEVEKLERDKSKKDEVKKLKKDLEGKGKKISDQMKKVLDQATKNFKNHATKVEDFLADAEKKLKQMAKDLKAFKKNHDHTLYQSNTNMPTHLQKLASDAQDDADDFGKSWFKARGVNFSSYKLNDKIPKPFYAGRSKLMGEQKPVSAKIDRLTKIVEEAKLLKNEFLAEFTSGQKHFGVLKEDCEDLRKNFKKELEEMLDELGRTENRVRLFKTNAEKAKGTVTTVDMSVMESGLKEKIAEHKKMTNSLKLMKKQYEQQAKFASGATGEIGKEISKELKQASEILKAIETGVIKKMEGHIKSMANYMKACSKLVAK